MKDNNFGYYTNESSFTELPHLNQKFLVKGMHLMKKMKEQKDSDRRKVLSECENV